MPLVHFYRTNVSDEDRTLIFEIPHRIDLPKEYSSKIDNDVNTRKEQPYRVYRYVRNAPENQTLGEVFNQLGLTPEHAQRAKQEDVSHIKFVDAGKYGTWVCYRNKYQKSTDSTCSTQKEFIDTIHWMMKD